MIVNKASEIESKYKVKLYIKKESYTDWLGISMLAILSLKVLLIGLSSSSSSLPGLTGGSSSSVLPGGICCPVAGIGASSLHYVPQTDNVNVIKMSTK